MHSKMVFVMFDAQEMVFVMFDAQRDGVPGALQGEMRPSINKTNLRTFLEALPESRSFL